MKKIHLIVAIVLLSIKLSAQQDGCYTDQYFQYVQATNPSEIGNDNNFNPATYRLPSTPNIVESGQTTIYIPIVFHVIHNGVQDITNIDDNTIYNQVTLLNQAFSNSNGNTNGVDTKMQFCLAQTDPNGNTTNGITRELGTQSSYNLKNSTDMAYVKSVDSWNSTISPQGIYLNVWVIPSNWDPVAGGANAFSTFPWDMAGAADGIVIDYRLVGNTPDGNVLVHETGHWCGLWHVFELQTGETACSSLTINDPGTYGDQVSDTPPVCGPAFCEVPTPNSSICTSICTQYSDNIYITSGSCAQRHSCSGTIIPAGDYMDYNYNTCRSFFTLGQRTRMWSELTNWRNNIISYNYNNPGLLPIACSSVFTPVNDIPTGDPNCQNLYNISSGFYLNGINTSTVSICAGTLLAINRNLNGNCLEIPTKDASFKCSNDGNGCSWFQQATGQCNCTINIFTYEITIWAGCNPDFSGGYEAYDNWLSWYSDDNFGTNEPLTTYDQLPNPINVSGETGFTFNAGQFYKVGLATLYNGWTQSIKGVYIAPNDLNLTGNVNGYNQVTDIIYCNNGSFSNTSNSTLIATKEIQFTGTTSVNGGAILAAYLSPGFSCTNQSQKLSGLESNDQNTDSVRKAALINAISSSATYNNINNTSANANTSNASIGTNLSNTASTNAKIKLFPSPSSDGILNGSIDDKSILYPINYKIVNVYNQTVQEGLFSDANLNLNLSFLPSGTYSLITFPGNKMMTSRFIIAK